MHSDSGSSMPCRMSDKKIKDKEKKNPCREAILYGFFTSGDKECAELINNRRFLFESVIWYVIMQKADIIT